MPFWTEAVFAFKAICLFSSSRFFFLANDHTRHSISANEPTNDSNGVCHTESNAEETEEEKCEKKFAVIFLIRIYAQIECDGIFSNKR